MYFFFPLQSFASQTPPTSNLSVALEKSLVSLTLLMAHLTSDLLPSVHSSAVNLSQQVGGNRSRQLVTDGHSLAASVSLKASKTARTSGMYVCACIAMLNTG